MRRWYVTGGAGSGKTTIARHLSTAFGIPHHDVDRRQLPAPDADQWIVEGAHLWGMDEYVTRADVVVWLDLPPRVTIPRILRRHVVLSVRRQNRHPGVRNLLRFASGQFDYHRKPARPALGPTDWDALSRAATAQLLAARGDDVVHVRTPREVREWRRGLAAP